MGYKIDDMAVLALYTLIGDNQDEDDPVSVGQVKEMMDNAIKRASRGGRRRAKKWQNATWMRADALCFTKKTLMYK